MCVCVCCCLVCYVRVCVRTFFLHIFYLTDALILVVTQLYSRFVLFGGHCSQFVVFCYLFKQHLSELVKSFARVAGFVSTFLKLKESPILGITCI